MGIALNSVLFQIGWFACVLGAANGLAWLGTLTALGIAAWHVARAERPRGEFTLITAAALLGLTWDSVNALSGLIHFHEGVLVAGLAPHWMVALWLVFATTLNVSLRWLRGRTWLAALFGAVGGPLAYYAGMQLGALAFPSLALALAAQALGWALITPLLVQLAQHLDGVSGARGPAHV